MLACTDFLEVFSNGEMFSKGAFGNRLIFILRYFVLVWLDLGSDHERNLPLL